jgi:hypothetical protein
LPEGIRELLGDEESRNYLGISDKICEKVFLDFGKTNKY